MFNFVAATTKCCDFKILDASENRASREAFISEFASKLKSLLKANKTSSV